MTGGVTGGAAAGEPAPTGTGGAADSATGRTAAGEPAPAETDDAADSATRRPAAGEAARRRPWWRGGYTLYFIFVHTPISITAVCVTMITKDGLAPWAAAVFGVGAVFLMIPAGWLGGRWGEQSRRESEALAKVPRPRRCDRCGEVEPYRCPRPWLGRCPLRSVETGQTYLDFLEPGPHARRPRQRRAAP
jgi:hypothetical protein